MSVLPLEKAKRGVWYIRRKDCRWDYKWKDNNVSGMSGPFPSKKAAMKDYKASKWLMP